MSVCREIFAEYGYIFRFIVGLTVKILSSFEKTSINMDSYGISRGGAKTFVHILFTRQV